MPKKKSGREYNYIYSKLVTRENGLCGFVAYCLYKRKKVDWIDNFTKDNGRGPTDGELYKLFSVTTENDTYIQGLMEEAKGKEKELLECWVAPLQTEKERLESLIGSSVRKRISPTLIDRVVAFFTEVFYTMLSQVAWFLIIVLINKLWPHFLRYIIGELKELFEYNV